MPRCGNAAFSEWFSDIFSDTKTYVRRFENHDDIVPQVPPKWLGFQHIG